MLSRSAAEIGTAAVTTALGLTVMAGALEFGIGWGGSGPAPGAFPFFVGLLVTGASLGNLAYAAFGRGRPQGVFFEREQAKRLAGFFVPVALFVVVCLTLGIYVATALYLTLTMWLQGGYRLIVAAATGIAAAAFFFVMLEHLFQVPLLKGPLEAAIGLY
jgi:hypothetical protein